MMLTNATITIYNHRYDSLTRFDTWHRTIIENVHVYVDHKASVGDSGLNSAEVYKIRIPTDVENADQYLPPEEYAKLEDPEEHWTIQTDDQIVLGEYAQEIERPADLKDVRLRHCKVLYVWPNGSFKKAQYYKGLAEITQVYENTSTETDELESQSTKKLQELCSKKIFGMDIAKLGIDVGIGDIVGGRDYLTGMYSSRPVANIIYSVTNRVESKEYELEGESDNGNS